MIDTQPLTWSPTSWQSRPALQQPKYASEEALRKVVEELAQMPPLVHRLKQQLADAALGSSREATARRVWPTARRAPSLPSSRSFCK